MRLGIVGLPNVGKSTLFNAITQAGAECANYPFCTIEPNVGIVAVPDERLKVLAEMYKTRKVTPAALEFVDIAGLVKGASKGEGLGNKFLSHIREVDAVLHVVRCFSDSNIIHVDSEVDPLRDIETIETELVLADIEALERRLVKAQTASKGGSKTAQAEVELCKALLAHLETGASARLAKLTDEQRSMMEGFFLISSKPVIYACNIDESDIGKDNALVERVRQFAASQGSSVLTVSAQVEADIAALDEDERQIFIDELGITESGLDSIIRVGYATLGLISFLTAGEKEVRAWTITKGTRAPQAAGKIHSDFERGFIRAEVVSYEALKNAGSMAVVKERGQLRSEGKDYVVCDGDVVLFRFNV